MTSIDQDLWNETAARAGALLPLANHWLSESTSGDLSLSLSPSFADLYFPRADGTRPEEMEFLCNPFVWSFVSRFGLRSAAFRLADDGVRYCLMIADEMATGADFGNIVGIELGVVESLDVLGGLLERFFFGGNLDEIPRVFRHDSRMRGG